MFCFSFHAVFLPLRIRRNNYSSNSYTFSGFTPRGVSYLSIYDLLKWINTIGLPASNQGKSSVLHKILRINFPIPCFTLLRIILRGMICFSFHVVFLPLRIKRNNCFSVSDTFCWFYTSYLSIYDLLSWINTTKLPALPRVKY